MGPANALRAVAILLATMGLVAPVVAGDVTITYTFNRADQLTQVSSSQGGVLASYTYDGDGLRATKTAGGATVIYVRGPSGEVTAEYSGSGALLAEYVYLDGQLLCKITRDAQGVEHRVYYHADIVGTPVVLTDEAGLLIANADYKPFGEEVIPGAAQDPHKFTGKELDDEVGLYYFGARYYDADIGRFISVDPVNGKSEDPQTWNRYVYGRNNPLRFVDPTGGYEKDVHLDLTTVIAFAVGFSYQTAGTIGLADQAVDVDPATGSFAGEDARAGYHFADESRRARLWAGFQESGSTTALGNYLHAQQDSFSHVGYDAKLGHW